MNFKMLCDRKTLNYPKFDKIWENTDVLCDSFEESYVCSHHIAGFYEVCN